MTEPTIAQLITEFTHAYERLYQRWPEELRMIDDTWVVVNGMEMNATGLNALIDELKREYAQTVTEKKKTTQRLVAWFSQDSATPPR